MRKNITLVFASLLLIISLTKTQTSLAALSEEGDLGVGIILGWPTGFTGKYKLIPPNQAIDFGLGWHIGNSFTIYGDYIYEFHNVFQHESEFLSALILYTGGGAFFEFISAHSPAYRNPAGVNRTSNLLMALRIPLGVEWPVPTLPIRLGLELVPGISIIPYTSLIMQGGITGRYYF